MGLKLGGLINGEGGGGGLKIKVLKRLSGWNHCFLTHLCAGAAGSSMLISSSSESESLSCLINQPWKYYINKYSSSQFTRRECAEKACNRTRKRIFLKSLTGDEDLLYFLNRRRFKSSDASFLWDLASESQDRYICKRQRQKFTSTSCTITRITLETYMTTYKCGGCYGRHRLLSRNGTSTIRDIEPLCCQLAPRFNHCWSLFRSCWRSQTRFI